MSAERGAPDAAGLERALRGAGVSCVVDAFDRLAVVVPGPGGCALALDEGVRRRALALLAAHGFTHLALELTADPGAASHAALPRA